MIEEEQMYMLPDDELDENQFWEKNQNTRSHAQNETHNDPGNILTELQQFHKPGLIQKVVIETMPELNSNKTVRLSSDI